MLDLPLTTAVLISLAIFIVGVAAAFGVAQFVKGFTWSKYAISIVLSVMALGIFTYFFGVKMIYLYLASALIGMCAEFLLGFLYTNVMQRPLWTYDKKALAIGNHTSLLTLPYWGNAGILFWTVAEYIELLVS